VRTQGPAGKQNRTLGHGPRVHRRQIELCTHGGGTVETNEASAQRCELLLGASQRLLKLDGPLQGMHLIVLGFLDSLHLLRMLGV
jgi:hypothetical protein